jgi:hypothetical protein
MKRLTGLLITCALYGTLSTSVLAGPKPPATPVCPAYPAPCNTQGSPSPSATPGRTPGPYDNLPPNPNPHTSSTLTPAGALIMQECAKAVLAGETVVKMHHFAQIDQCVALVRAGLLAR